MTKYVLREHNDSSHTDIVVLCRPPHPSNTQGCRRKMKLCLIPTTVVAAAAVIFCFTMLPSSSVQSLATARPLRVAVFGGTGYVGSAVCDRLVQRGHIVTAISRRGVNPRPNSDALGRVNWVKGDATDYKVVEKVLKDSDAAVHAIGTYTTVVRPRLSSLTTKHYIYKHTHAHAPFYE